MRACGSAIRVLDLPSLRVYVCVCACLLRFGASLRACGFAIRVLDLPSFSGQLARCCGRITLMSLEELYESLGRSKTRIAKPHARKEALENWAPAMNRQPSHRRKTSQSSIKSKTISERSKLHAESTRKVQQVDAYKYIFWCRRKVGSSTSFDSNIAPRALKILPAGAP